MVNKAASGLTALLLLTSGLPAFAESLGTGSALDRRVQTALYSPDNVYRIQASVGRTSLVQLPANETINEASGLMVSGDPKAWSIGPNKAGNLVAIKPITDQEPNTNLVINTNRHTYLLELKLVTRPADMTYALRFTYPEPPKKTGDVRRDPGNPCDGPVQYGPYQKRSNAESKSIGPYEGWDNGMLTCFRFTGNGPRPVLYQVLPDGTETLADAHNEQNVVVVHGVSRLFRFRLNSLVVEVRPTAQVNTGYNFNGTTTGEIRELKHAEQ
ncbi:VirB9 [Pseudomonas syringae pv. philadelphi]|uniref:VirB9 n=1 Tax=Pseudomonas syringae pv. philadelphi TaxID=251706 RepID=A0A3M3ZVS0_9PSED|nr:P-type conjugative transfer protein VirB9 [Pseudomonas syringae group genomosp. 3]RMO98750.1 VirB9 [Pseudomonas syringae pv. philadelphi]